MLIIELFTESKKITTEEVAEDAMEKRVFLNKRDQLFKRLAAETDPKNKEIIRQAIKQLEQQSQEFLPKAN